MRNLMTRTVANVVTLLNIILGSLSLVFTLDHNYQIAAILILLAVVMDSLDGRVARKLNAESEMGKELDSLCDLVSFGVAPAILLYTQVLAQPFEILGTLAVILLIVCGALRLARFNILNIKEYFLGVPITLNGMLLAVVSLFAAYLDPVIVLLAVFALALLMVSNFKVPKIK